MIEEGTLETNLKRTEADVESALRTAQALVTQLKRVQKATATGVTRDLTKVLEHSVQLAGSTRDAVVAAKSGWRFATGEYLDSGGFTREVLDLAAERGVIAQEEDGRIVSFPSLVRILPSDEAIEVDRKKSVELRPSKVVDRLQQAQTRPPRFRAEPFLKALHGAYELVVRNRGREAGEVVPLVDVYRVFTMLPGQRSAYAQQEFVRDIYLLDESGVSTTSDGLRVTLPAATGAKTSSVLRAVTRDGRIKTYYGIAFRR
jgi:hypothetical protein